MTRSIPISCLSIFYVLLNYSQRWENVTSTSNFGPVNWTRMNRVTKLFSIKDRLSELCIVTAWNQSKLIQLWKVILDVYQSRDKNFIKGFISVNRASLTQYCLFEYSNDSELPLWIGSCLVIAAWNHAKNVSSESCEKCDSKVHCALCINIERPKAR